MASEIFASALQLTPPSVDSRSQTFQAPPRLSIQVITNWPVALPAAATDVASAPPADVVISVAALQLAPELVERRTYTLPFAPTVVEPLYSSTSVPAASDATVVTEEVANVAPVLSVSTTVRVHEVPPSEVVKTTIGTGPVSLVALPFSGYLEATITAVPLGSTVAPFG